MTDYSSLSRDRLLDLAQTQAERIRTLDKRLQDETQAKRRLQEQIITLTGKLADAKRYPRQETA